MILLASLHNRLSAPSFLVNSLPKAGTYLLAKAVSLCPGIDSAELHIGYSTLAYFTQSGNSAAGSVPIGVDWPQQASLLALQRALARVGRARYATSHIPFSEELARLLNEMGMKSLLILRDPRDVVVSHANYIARTPTHFLHKSYEGLSESERIMASIKGIKATARGDPMLLSISARYRSVLPWASQSFNCTTCFERLVGPEGGGSRDAQIEELENIARHLAIQYGRGGIERVAQQLFGGTSTFEIGMGGHIGNWRHRLSAEHKDTFKELAGDLLIELGYELDYDW